MFFQPFASNARRLLHRRAVLLAWLLTASVASGAVGPSEIWKINPDGTGLERVVGTPGETCGSPEYSPDGKFIAYGRNRLDQTLYDTHIIVCRADGKEPRDLGPGGMATFSPDGKQLVFHTYEKENEPPHIVIMNADGTGRKNILDHWGSPRWCRTGNRIYSILNGNIARYDLTTGKEQTILPESYSMYWGFGVSPDAKRICFSGYESNLYLATLDEKSQQATVRTLLDHGKSTYAAFAPDGKRIVFSYIALGTHWMQLYTMDVDKDKKPKHLDGQNKTRLNWGPTWSPDGKTILFGSKATDVIAGPK